MGLLDRVKARLLPAPQISPWQAGEPYSREEWAPADYGDYLATSNDVYACAWLRAKNLAKLPLLAENQRGEILDPTPSLLEQPNPHMSRQRLVAHMELCLAIWGETALLLDKGRNGGPNTPPREMWPCKPTSLKAIPHATEYVSGYVFSPPGGGTPIPLRPDEVVFIQYPNPNDAYAPLAPMAAVRLAAEVAAESMKANRNLFSQGMMAGGFIMPPDQTGSYTEQQAQELERVISRKFSGQSNAHRWQVLRYMLTLKEMNVTPKDAEWIGGANLTFRQVCRGLGVPPPLVGDAEFATLANLEVYERALWEHTLQFEAEYVGADLTRQLAPSLKAGRVFFDLSDVVALQEDENARWARAREQIELGAITVNEWREEEGLSPVEWGSVWWADPMKAPVDGKPQPQETGRILTRTVPRRLDLTEEENGLASDLEELMRRQQDAALQTLRQGERSAAAAAEEPFDLPRWRERTRAACHARFVAATERTMISEARLLRMTPEQVAELLESKTVRAAVEGNVQRFAHRITTTTYNQVKAAISKGMRRGETVDQIASRVAHVMGIRISEARMIAQSEMTRSRTTGQIATYQAAGLDGKRWMTQQDDDVRDSHRPMHGIVKGLGELFQVGGGSGLGPGQIDSAAESINCRCWLEPARLAGDPRADDTEAIFESIHNGEVSGHALRDLLEALQ